MTTLDSNEVREIVVDVTSTLGLPSTPAPLTHVDRPGAEIGLHGGFEGAIQVCCEPAVAHLIAATLGLGSSDEEAQGALWELTNVMAGNLKVILPQTDGPARLSPPTPAREHAEPPIGECSVRCEAGHITVRVFETPPTRSTK